MPKFYAPRQADTRVQVCGRLSYAHLWEPRAIGDGAEKKYSVAVLIPKDDVQSVEAVKTAIIAAKNKGLLEKWAGKLPKNYRNPLRDGDQLTEEGERMHDDNYKNCYFFNCSSKTPVQMLDKNKLVITDRSEVYSGCYAYVSVNFFPYTNSGSNGVTGGLNAVMKVADGESFGGQRDAASDFDFVQVSTDIDDL